jgi:hypothetical protein
VGDLRISKLCSGHTRTGSAQRYNHTCSNDDWFLHDLLLGGSKGPEARGTGGPRLPSQRLRSPSVPTLEEESWNDLLSDRFPGMDVFGPPLPLF